MDERSILKKKIFSLMDEVKNSLAIDNDIDKFLDGTTLFDEWEDILPDAEYGIFVIAILNNIRTKVIINTLIDSVLKVEKLNHKKISNKKEKLTSHPFC
tara:strand:- start:174 stop:470 length:297 start_codon:yes stop_codon:yes gene_type:complete